MKQTSPLLLSTFLALGASPPLVGAQLTYRSTPELQWDAQINSVVQGNGVFLAPDEEIVVASTRLGYVSAFGSKDGSEVFQYAYDPNTTAIEFISSDSGIAFAPDYMVYSVLINKGSVNPLTRVVALSMSGEQLWVSPSLKGSSSGTPVVSEDGAYIFLTHNSMFESIGHFTILDGATGLEFFTQTNEAAPFAPLGIHHSPAEGYYDGGENNQNDIMVWSVQPLRDDNSVGPGATFAFQFPIGFTAGSDAAGLAYTQLGSDVKDFQTIQKPTFADEGRSLYWGTSRSQFRCWLGEEGLDRFRFGRPRTATVGFSRGTPPMQAVFARLAISKDPINRFVFGGTASNEFVKMSGDFADETLVPTGELVKSMAHISPDDAYVYYLETDGTLHQANTLDLSDRWVLDVGAPTEGEFALNSDGTMLYVGDASGFVHAFRVGDVPTEAPSAAPSSLPTLQSSANPTTAATPEPTAAPTSVPSQFPTVLSVTSAAVSLTASPTEENLDTPTTTSTTTTSGASYQHMGPTAILLALSPLVIFYL